MPATLDLDWLRTFVAAVEGKSFTTAARRVHRSPAAVSMQIQKLEAVVGGPLFVRDTRNLALTATGDSLLTYARQALRLHDEAYARLRHPEVSGRVSIGAPDDYIASLLPPALRRFAAAFPAVEIELVCKPTTELVPMLAAGSLDLAFVTRTTGIDGAFVRLEPMDWVAAAGIDLLGRDPLPVALYEAGCGARLHTDLALERAGIVYRAAYSSPSLLGLMVVVEAGLAVAALARCSIPPTVRVLEGTILPAIDPLEIVLARSPSAHHPACDALSRIILETVGPRGAGAG